MSEYQALYRKYRPQGFDSVVGQEHVVKTLKNQLKSGRVSHAYLFCGTRGTGKTSVAKIFAKAINCLNPSEDGEPCNKCELCVAANEGRSVNVIEIDAASNNSVDSIREIREEVKYTPTEGSYKVYIIDEVHMLSTGAHNALLKTLEEPPKHVVFILATTDPQKIPATILSRCQRFDFKRISAQEIANALKSYTEKEGIDIEEDALYLIARLADGSMRDSLSILDQCSAFYYGEHITREKVLEVAGSVDNSVFIRVTDNILNKNAQALMQEVDEMMINGRDAGQFVKDYIAYLRNLFIATAIPDSAAVLGISGESAAELGEQAKRITRDEVTYLINVFSKLDSDIKYASNKRVLLEICLIKLCAPVTENSYDAVAAKLSGIERELKSGKYTKVSAPAQSGEVKKEKPKKKLNKAVTEDYKKAVEVWADIVSEFGNPNDIILKRAELKQLDGEKIYVVCANESNSRVIETKTDKLKEMFAEKLGIDFEIEVISKKDFDKRYELIYGTTEEKEEYDDSSWDNLISTMPGIEIEQ